MDFFKTGFLGGIPIITNGVTRSISAENPNGEKSGGAKAVPVPPSGSDMLGQGWKVRPCVKVEPKSVFTVAEISGPGVIRHIWMTAKAVVCRNCVLRIYWDGEATPSVEVPVGDFFCCGHGKFAKVNSIPIAVNPSGGMNSYWPMPFRKSVRIELDNQCNEVIDGFYYQVDYELCDVPEDAGYFHAQWRRSITPIENPEHTILDGIKGKGQYVGTYLAWVQCSDGWWGEGEIKFYMDGDGKYPTICGTGTEDYFGGAWGFYDPNDREDTFDTPFLGYPFCEHKDNTVPKHGLYRWHIMDPIRFAEELKVTIQALGWWDNGTYEPLRDDISSVGYWYQLEPHTKFPEMLPVHLRWSR